MGADEPVARLRRFERFKREKNKFLGKGCFPLRAIRTCALKDVGVRLQRSRGKPATAALLLTALGTKSVSRVSIPWPCDGASFRKPLIQLTLVLTP